MTSLVMQILKNSNFLLNFILCFYNMVFYYRASKIKLNLYLSF